MPVNQKFTIIPFSSPTQEAILETLSKGPVDGVDLLEQVSQRGSVTKQGLYKALRQLLHQEIILKERRLFTLNKVWLSRFKDFVESSEKDLGLILPFIDTDQKRRKVVTFKNTEALDIYWGHLFLALTDKFKDKPFFFYNHHNWSVHGRTASDLYLYKASLRNNYHLAITLGKDTPLARDFKKRYGKGSLQIAIDDKISVPQNDHIMTVDDYLIITRYDNQTMQKINKLFMENVVLGENEKKELHKTILASKKQRLIIIKDAKIAQVWRRRLARNFVVKKSEL